MSIEKITAAIIDEAQAECEQILNAAGDQKADGSHRRSSKNE